MATHSHRFVLASIVSALAASTASAGTNGFCFTLDDGTTECGSSETNEATVNGMTVHLSCSANYDEFGYPDKDQPDSSLGDPAVVEYSVNKWKVDGDGVCEEDKTCGDEFDVVPDDCPNTSACVQLAEAWDRGDAILSTSDSLRLEITNLGVNDICDPERRRVGIPRRNVW